MKKINLILLSILIGGYLNAASNDIESISLLKQNKNIVIPEKTKEELIIYFEENKNHCNFNNDKVTLNQLKEFSRHINSTILQKNSKYSNEKVLFESIQQSLDIFKLKYSEIFFKNIRLIGDRGIEINKNNKDMLINLSNFFYKYREDKYLIYDMFSFYQKNSENLLKRVKDYEDPYIYTEVFLYRVFFSSEFNVSILKGKSKNAEAFFEFIIEENFEEARKFIKNEYTKEQFLRDIKDKDFYNKALFYDYCSKHFYTK